MTHYAQGVTPYKLNRDAGFFMEEVVRTAKESTNRLALDQDKIAHTKGIGARSHSSLSSDYIQRTVASTFRDHPNVRHYQIGALHLFIVSGIEVNYVFKISKIIGRRFPNPTTKQKMNLFKNQLDLGLNQPTVTVCLGYSMDSSRSYVTGAEVLVRDDDGSVVIKQSVDSIRMGNEGKLQFVGEPDSTKIPETRVVGKFDTGSGHNSATGAQ